MEIKTFIIFLLSTIFMTSCELSTELDIDLPIEEPSPVIEAYLVAGRPFQMLFFESNTLIEPVRINLIWNASVNIIRGDDSLRLKNILKVDQETAYMYNYINNDSIVSGSVEKYSLYIESEDRKPVTAVCIPVDTVNISELNIEADLVKLTTINCSNSGSNYYILRLYKYRSGELADIEQLEVDMHQKPEGPVDIKYNFMIQDIDSMRLDLYRVDSTAYRYHRSISNALNANRDPFATPAPFEGNVENALGIFTCVSIDSRMLRF